MQPCRDRPRPATELLAPAILLAVLAAFFAPVLFGGAVLYPHDNSAEAGLEPEPSSPYRSTPRYSDVSTEYVPELHQHLTSGHASWLATWNPHNGFGLPLMHYYSLGPAFIVGHVLSWFTDDAFRMYTWLAVLAVSGAALFCFLFLQALGLHPLACLAGALAISVCPFHAAWQTFIQLDWGFCWTFAFLWGFERLLRRESWGRWIWIVFSLHALLLCGYPQYTVWCAYMGGGFVILRLVRERDTARARMSLLMRLAGAAGLAILTAAPVYLDIWGEVQRSTRAEASIAEALHILPRLESWGDLRVFLLQLFDTFWMGDPLGDGYPKRISVIPANCVTPFYASAILLALGAGRFRRAWYWLCFGCLVLLVIVWAPAFRFGVHYFGLSFSHLSLIVPALPPLAVLAAMGVDGVLSGASRSRGAALAVAAIPLAVAVVIVAGGDIPLVSARVGVGVAFAVGAALFAWTAWRWLLVVLVVGSVFCYGWQFVYTRPRADVKLDSPLVQRIQQLTPHGTRFAWIGARKGSILSPNQEVLLGLRSVHVHTSLPSAQFSRWASELASPLSTPAGAVEVAPTYSRRFQSIEGEHRLTRDMLSTSGIALLLSTHMLRSEMTLPLVRIGGVCLSRVKDVGPQQAQVQRWETDEQGALVEPDDLFRPDLTVVRRDTGQDDRLRFDVEPREAESLLFVSQEFHADWKASAAGRRLETVRVNGLFQGVVLPPETREVELRFLPWARWSLVPQALFGAAALVAVLRWLRSLVKLPS